jgi:uncharacterized glyoxalase superfamily protein PhnB
LQFGPTVKPNRSIPSATVVPVLIYPDVRAAVAWLEAAFGFSERVRIGEAHRAQMSFGDGAVIAADVRGRRRPPRPGESTSSVLVRVEPTDFEYGERQYHVEDLAGHQWTFSETLADMAPEQWGGESVD